VGFPAIFIALSLMLLAVAALAPVVAPGREAFRVVTSAGQKV
jgi:hypothetical protein